MGLGSESFRHVAPYGGLMPVSLLRFIATVAVGGVAATVAVLLLHPLPAVDLPLLLFSAAALLAIGVPIRVERTGGTQGFTVEGGVVFAMFLSGYAVVAPLVMVVTSLLGHSVRTRQPAKVMLNVGRSGLETGLASLVFMTLAPVASPTDLRSVAAVLVSAAVFELVSSLVMTELFYRLSGSRRDEVIREVGRLAAITFAGNSAYGIVLATLATVNLYITTMAVSLLLVTYLGYRGYATALEGKRRAEAVKEITHVLLDMLSDVEGSGELLRDVVDVFGGHRGRLLIETPSGRREWLVERGLITTSWQAQMPRTGLLASVMAQDRSLVGSASGEGHDAIAAPVRGRGEPVGALMVEGRRGLEPWDDSDVALLSAIGNELAVALDNMALFRQVEEERARLEAESTTLNDILTAATDGIVSMQADGTIDSWNPGMANITGVAPEDAIGRPWYAVLRLKDGADRDLAPATDLLDSHVATNEVGPSLSFQVMRVDGEWRRLQCTISPVRGPGGDERGVVLVARDVTAEREVDELKSDFIATVSHELRTPLTPLKGFLTTLQNAGEDLSSEQAETVFRSMGSQLARLEALIADLLAVAELDRGQLDLHTGPVQLSQLVPHAVDSEAGSQRDRCTVEVADVVAQADPVAIVRIVRSLVSNALKHTEGPVQVLVGTEGEWTTISVVDEGPGIPQWDQQRIFGRFDRLGNHLQRTQGPGLGLTIARSLAQRMGGDILLDSELGTGSTFTLKVPTARPRLVTPPVMQAVE